MDEILKDPEKAGVIAIMITILGTGLKRLWVWGYQLVDMTADRDFWRNTAMTLMKVTEKQSGVKSDAD